LFFDRPPAGGRDAVSHYPNHLRARLHHLALCCRKPGSHEPSEQLPVDAMAMQKQLLVYAMPTAREPPKPTSALLAAGPALNQDRRSSVSAACRLRPRATRPIGFSPRSADAKAVSGPGDNKSA